MALYSKIGEFNFVNLLADPKGANKVALPLEPGNGKLTRGIVLYRKSTGLYAPATTSQLTASYSLAVLDEDVDTNENLVVAEDAGCYIAGNLLRGKVKLKSGDTITAAYELVMRQQGLVLQPMDGSFDNARRVITYKANNGATPAEADYLAYAGKGETHTVLANSVTGFTAPEGKSFSKWNTKADGTGTDYAAAASYTANDDLTLYAVWAS